MRQRIAIIGSGISGMASAYLLNQQFDVTLIEKNSYLGGHTNTVSVTENETEAETELAIDTGFIVFNTRNYPLFTQFLDQLAVAYAPADMAFGFHDRDQSFWYSSDIPRGIFSQKRQLISPKYWRFLADIRRFNAIILRDLATNAMGTRSLGDYIKTLPVSDLFKRAYLLPMGAAIWSCPLTVLHQFPAVSFFKFWRNHALLTLRNRPQWQTVVGGAKHYINAVCEQLSGDIITGDPAVSVSRHDTHCQVHLKSGRTESYDYCIMATHADQALALLSQPTPAEQRLLSPWTYSENTAYLHQDPQFMPPRRTAWASWLVQHHGKAVYMTYYMNRLQSLKTAQNYFVTLGPPDLADTHPTLKPIRKIVYHHPVFNLDSMATQPELSKLNTGRVRFCGSYFGDGFHEDGMRAARDVCQSLGCDL